MIRRNLFILAVFSVLLIAMLSFNVKAQESTKIESDELVEYNLNSNDADYLYESGNLLLDEYRLSEAKDYFLKAAKLYQKNKRFEYLGNTYLNLGYIADMNSEFDLAIEYYLKAIDSFERIDFKPGLADSYNNIGIIYCMISKYEEGLKYYLLSLEIEEEQNNDEGISYSLGNIGLVYRKMGNIDKAIEYYKKSINIKEKLDDKLGLARTYGNLGSLYVNVDSVDIGLEYFETALSLNEEIGEMEGKGYALHNIGDALVIKGEYDEAIIYLNQALDIRTELENITGQISTLYSLAEAYFYKEQYQEFLIAIDNSYQMAIEIDEQDMLLQIYYLYYEFYELKSDIANALAYLEKYTELKLKIDEQTRAEEILEMQARFDTEKKETEIKEKEGLIKNLQQERKIQDLQIANAKQLRTFLILVMVLVLIISYVLFKRYRLKAQLNSILEEKNLELRESNATKNKFFSIISHDLSNYASLIESVSGMISRKHEMMDAEKLSENLKTLNHTAIKNKELIKSLLDWAVAQSRRLKINPEKHAAFGFVKNIVDSLQQVANDKSIELKLFCDDDVSFYADKNTIETVIRNLISNAIKFSDKNSEVHVITEYNNSKTRFTIKDFGIGMSSDDTKLLFRTDVDPKTIGDSPNKGTGFGLKLCKGFVEMNSGNLFVESELNKGTSFIFELPTKA